MRELRVISVAVNDVYFFFFQAEDGIRDWSVTGVQTCALPISHAFPAPRDVPHRENGGPRLPPKVQKRKLRIAHPLVIPSAVPSACEGKSRDHEIGERRVGKECRSRWSPYH